MLLLRVYVNLDEIDTIGIINTGHIDPKTEEHLYRVHWPEDYKAKYNHLEIYHLRTDPWTVLVEKVMSSINAMNQAAGSGIIRDSNPPKRGSIPRRGAKEEIKEFEGFGYIGKGF
jgi:hypothetical protein